MGCPEKELEISEEKAKSVEIGGFKLGKWLFPLFYLVLILFFVFDVFLNKVVNELIYIAIPLFVVYLYYITLGRKKYLEIREL
jgi:hypothetical protein